MHYKIERKRHKLQLAKNELDNTVKSIQKICKHKNIFECDYQPLCLGGALPPTRICFDCGLTEDGWHCGYLILRGDRVGVISRNDLYRLRIGLMITDEHKGPLLRNEISIQDLIDKN